ncbi:MAG: YihA family ribosome biogenesis GTP-binding protein [Lachnospiraceae bacterium]|nr:YihA family ribosome biogenesis GTP-binding protein [Lachnospiraceae bacterium]
MVIKKVSLDIVIGVTSRLPETDRPEFAFAGRSNVGKSSLLNALILRKNYARTSSQPGKTQTINYYNVNDEFFLVDLPGYGYAKVSEETRAKWGRMIERYLRQSKELRQVFLLVDMRHEPTANDCQMIGWIRESGFTPVVIATKADKLSRNEQNKMIPMIRKKLEMKKEELLIPFSAETKAGRDEIAALIDGMLSDQAAEEG